MDFSSRILAAALLLVASSIAYAEIRSPVASLIPLTVAECHDLECFGHLALREKLEEGSLKLPLQVYDQGDCTHFGPLSCMVIPAPRYRPQAVAWLLGGQARSYQNCHDLECMGTLYIGELYYDRQSINAVALTDKAQCSLINAAAGPDIAVPCFHMDSSSFDANGQRIR